jgi:predicted nucleic acid-binding Zn ribbon protein
MAFLDKITKATQDVVRGAKDLTDVARLNSLIADEQRQINNLYSQIGKLYYETSPAETDSPIGKLCHAITAANERIGKHNEEIRQIKGIRKCPSCGADLPLSLTFCGMCGAKIETQQDKSQDAPKMFCTDCGTEIPEGVSFCTSCGQKIVKEIEG